VCYIDTSLGFFIYTPIYTFTFSIYILYYIMIFWIAQYIARHGDLICFTLRRTASAIGSHCESGLAPSIHCQCICARGSTPPSLTPLNSFWYTARHIMCIHVILYTYLYFSMYYISIPMCNHVICRHTDNNLQFSHWNYRYGTYNMVINPLFYHSVVCENKKTLKQLLFNSFCQKTTYYCINITIMVGNFFFACHL